MTRGRGAAEQTSLFEGRDEQFRLARLQLFRWGTFEGVHEVSVAPQGYLFVGPSGSGKSTLLDAHAALLTPPKWVDFNVAAREAERGGRDRSLMSYVRGAWAQQTGEGGEYAVQYLRTGTTWSAIAETYRDDEGGVVVLAQVLWVRGNASATTDVQKRYLVLGREFDVRELEFFAQSNFDVRRLKQELEGAFISDEFSAYQERFRGMLGIDSERALRLLHKTQSAKNLGDLNVFLRDFMLDTPETFAAAERLVSEFGELNAAHEAVVAAREQIEALEPARAAHEELARAERDRSVLEEVLAGVDAFREQRRHAFLGRRIDELKVDEEGARQEVERLSALVDDEFRKLSNLKAERAGLGAGLAQLEQELTRAERERPGYIERRDRAQAACRVLDWPMPDSAPGFVKVVAQARERLARATELAQELEQRKDALKERRRTVERDFAEVRTEIEAMERQPSNIPAHMLALRAQIAEGIGVPEDRLPFAGELLQVKKDAAAWQGAIERVLHAFALSILVDDKHYPAVSSYVNDRHVGQRLVYLRMLPHDEKRRGAGPSSLVRKLDVADVPEAAWLREELVQRFDYECAESVLAFRSATRAVTQAGQIKHSGTRHEKDDRHRIDDRRRWVLGFDNRDKLRLFKDRAVELASELAALGERLAAANDEGARQQKALLSAQTLANLSWAEVDVASLLARIAGLTAQIAAEAAARPELAQLDAQIAGQDKVHAACVKRRNDEEDRRRGVAGERTRLERALGELPRELLSVALTPTQAAELEARFANTGRKLALETLDWCATSVVRALGERQKELAARISELKAAIERAFAEFNRRWPAESGGLDPVLASASDYFAKLTRLETDGLPRFQERFMQLLREQSDQNLTLLSTRLDLERKAIRARLELVNESLLSAPFNPGTHLVIEPLERTLEDVRAFKQSLKEALSQSFSGERELAERRFHVLRALVKRLSSQEAADKSWRNTVLDVRQHVEFVARELDEENREVEIYRSGAGKSGGQRQKLAATCLAAALRYQLGGQDRALPAFATVVLDEAFDKADADFTTMAMNIFKTFGFQMIVATPLKSVMTLEPFIGGACFVHIKDRKSSHLLSIDYDEEAKRLELPEGVRHGQEAAVS